MTTIPPCAGKWELFDSTDPHDHAEAKRLCGVCPMVAECRALLKSLTKDRPRGGRGFIPAEYGPQGTWAGEPVGATKVNVRGYRIRAEDRMFNEDEAREAHANYQAGFRDARTEVGERVYQRRKAREKYARRRAAA